MSKLIVEVCQNHGGDRNTLSQMVKAAAENGADMLKMQTIYSADLTKRERFEEGATDDAGEQMVIKRPYDAEFERLKALDLTIDDHQFFIDTCVENSVTPFTTVFSRHRVEEVGSLHWPERVVKIASYDCASLPLLKELAEHFDHFIISTGSMYDNEIEETAKFIKDLGKKLTFLHCVTSYPNTLEMCNLKRMEWLRQFTDSVGWSDHTLIERDGITAAKVAIMLGADYVERHFTILGAGDTKDGPVSITPVLLKELDAFRKLSQDEQKAQVESEIPDWEIMLGSETREMTPTELLNRDYYRGRFASPKPNQSGPEEDQWVYNWEDAPLS